MQIHRDTVLVVDDEISNLKVLSSLLKTEVEVIVAKSGKQAIDLAKKQIPSLILLDVVMPDMDGFEVIKQLRTIPELADIPVIFITGLNSSEQEEKGLSLGAQDYIYKPFNHQVVKARVETQLKILRQTRQLKNMSQELAKASEAKSRFLAHMSHEIRTPLTSVIGYAESILAGEIAPDEQQSAVSTISKNGAHLLNLINEILDLSKIEANKLEIELIGINLISTLEEVRSIVEQSAIAKCLSLNFNYQYPLPEKIISDPTRLKQILVNLVNNAIKFTKSGAVDVTISTENNLLGFQVQDSGIGIAEAQLQQLFEAFTQADSSVTREFGGTGLGLNISKYLAKRLGGDISVTSEIGKGSCFAVNTQLMLDANTKQIHSYEDYLANLSGVDTDAAASELTGHILLAEDHDENRALIVRMLEHLNLSVDAVENGKELVEASLLTDYDLILSDINMPEMGGVEAVTLMNSMGNGIPVVALTANAMAHEISEYLAAGFDAHISKPIERKQFVKVLTQFLDGNANDFDDAIIPEEELKLLTAKYVESLKVDLADLKQCLVDKLDIKLQGKAHDIKGAASLYGFVEIGKVAGKIEDLMKNGASMLDNHEIMTHYEQLTALIIDVVE